MTVSRIIGFLAAVLLALLLPAAAHAQMSGLSEYQVKAAFLYNFAKFTEWSAGVGMPGEHSFTLCIAGKDPFGTDLAAIEGRPVHGLELRVQRNVVPDNVRGCQMLFVAESEEQHMAAILKAVQDQPVLTVGDSEGFSDAGGMITLVTVNGRVQFDVNQAAVMRANLRLNSQLLKLARSVNGAKRN